MEVLVVHYSQTGQLTDIVNSVIAPLQSTDDVNVDFEEVKPMVPFPFPWSSKEFFDAFPESFQEIPREMEPYSLNMDKTYDLIILAYQTWYLSPSIPISSFLQSSEAERIFNNTPVVTLVGCRNMWLSGQEKMKSRLKNLNARLVGNIVLFDRAFNLKSVYTILRWMLYGKKGNSGVSQTDIQNASQFGNIILQKLSGNNLEELQPHLVQNGAITVIPNLMSLEKTANKLFAFWARFVRKRGGTGDPARRTRLKFFAFYLLNGIALLSPLTTLIFYLTSVFRLKRIKREKEYLTSVNYEEGRFVNH